VTVPRARPDTVFIPRFLCERALRSNLQALFVSTTGAGENCRALLEPEVLTNGWQRAAGNDLVKSCFRGATRWLARAAEFSISDSVYTAEMIEPARSTAKFLMEIRRFSKRTANISCFILSKSTPHFDKYYGEKVSTLSLVIPAMQTVATLRCEASVAESLPFGTCQLKDVQPIPFVNRIHPLSIRDCTVVSPEKHTIRLRELDFLKVHMEDVPNIPRSIALENFCEFESIQTERRHLGFACIITGIMVSVRGPRLTLQSISNSQFSLDFILTPTLLAHIGGDGFDSLENYRGKKVRLFAIVWYHCHRHKKMPSEPEILLLQPVADGEEPIMDEIVGFVRLRGTVSNDTIRAHFGEITTRIPKERLEIADDYIGWKKPNASGDLFVDTFLKQIEGLRSLREKVQKNAFPLSFRDVFDIAKLRLAALGERISSDPDLLLVFLGLISHSDSSGLAAKFDPNDFPKIHAAIAEEKFTWLKEMGFIVRDKGKLLVRKDGTDVLYFAIRKWAQPLLKQMVLREHVVALRELSTRSNVPPSMCLLFLKEMERNGEIQCLHLDGRRCDLFWFGGQTDSTAKDACVSEFEKELAKIMVALNSVHHAIGTLIVQQRLRELKLLDVDLLDLQLLLNELLARRRIHKEETESEMWLYSWEDRLRDVLAANREKAFTIDELIARTNLRPIDRLQILTILKQLVEEEFAMEIFRSRWSLNCNDREEMREKIEGILTADLRQFVIDLLKQNAGIMTKGRLASLAQSFVIEEIAETNFFPGPSQEVVQRTIEKLRSDGEIRVDDNMIELIQA
jgi:hypothetical protein